MIRGAQTPRATIDDLCHVPDKAEIVDGELILMPPTGVEPGYAGDEIFASLREYARPLEIAQITLQPGPWWCGMSIYSVAG